MSKKKPTLDDIFNDDDFGLLDSKAKTSTVKTEEDRLIDSFEEINIFYDNNNREPSSGSMTEYKLLAKLKNLRQNEEQKKTLKPFDRHDLLGHVEIEKPSIDDILNEDDDLLDTDKDLSIFKYKHTPNPEDRAETDFVAQRKPMKEKDFAKYEAMFIQVHKEIKEGKRKIAPFSSSEKNLLSKQFYLMDGLLLYLEVADITQEEKELNSGSRVRYDGRTKTIFENGTISNMYFRSLGKQLLKNGKIITQSDDNITQELFVNAGLVKEEDQQTGWVYVLKSLSKNPSISSIENLYKIGFTSTPIDKRIQNASKEATYLFADVQKVATYACYNRNADKLEELLHRFFATACLDIDLFNDKKQRLNPREWFVVPFEVIEEAINLILKERIINYYYDSAQQKIKLK